MNLEKIIDSWYELPQDVPVPDDFSKVFADFRDRLNRGLIRAAEKRDDTWTVNAWVKKGILLGFRFGKIVNFSGGSVLSFTDKETFPLRRIAPEDSVRVVPGGSSIRDGAFIGNRVTCMPPMYINVGAYVDEGTMIDSHALVGSCAQVGKRVHVSAGSQIGGVLEPIGSLPVIIEDDVLIGGNSGIYEGTVVRRGAVIGAGTVITGGTPVYDLVHERVLRREGTTPLEIPPDAVVVPGSRPLSPEWARSQGLSLYTPIIIKYRDEKTRRSTTLEELLR